MLLSQLIKNSRGFGMMMVLVAISMAGGLAYYIMQSSDFMGKIDEREMINFDRENLATELKMILQTDNNCNLSITGNFIKSKIDGGLPVEVWMGKERKFKDGDSYYKLKIISLRLFMNAEKAENLSEGVNTELGNLKVKYDAGDRDMSLMIPISVSFKTHSSGLNTIIGCRIPASEDLCQSVDMVYNDKTGRCNHEDACNEWFGMAGEGEEEDWIGERIGNCSDNIGSHVRDISLSQMRTTFDVDTNGISIKCCFPKTKMSVRCFDFEESAGSNQWHGNAEAFCDMLPGGFMQSLILSQRQLPGASRETNGLMIRCCYPF